MTSIKFKRIKQVFQYGWKDAKEISSMQDVHRSRLSIFIDIIKCFCKYYVFSNQYKKNRLWELTPISSNTKVLDLGRINLQHDAWLKDYYENRQWLNKWMKYEWETTSRRCLKRNRAYQKHFKTGNISVQYNVDICREHFLNGTLRIGENVVLAKNVFIDYSGDVVIKNNVKIAAGVSIESHHRDIDAYNRGEDVNIPTQLIIEEGAYIGTHSTILDSCNYIGKHARIGAGAVVVKDIPDYAVAVGVPAKVVKIIEH